MATIKVRVQGEIATNLTPEVKLVCQNDKYDVEFEFDESWANSNVKTALFIYNGKVLPVVFDRELDGNVCKIPALFDTELLHIGVKSDDYVGLHTSTPAKVGCLLSANDIANGEIPAPTQEVYDQIIELLNNYISFNPLSEEEVIEIADKIASEKIDNLINGADEAFDTLKEIADWIKEHPNSIIELNSKIQANSDKILANEQAIININKLVSLLAEEKQNKSDKNLLTVSKEIVGAINEVKTLAETAKMIFGETEGTAYEGNKGKANADNIKELQNKLASVNMALTQSGLVKKYKQPITQEYNERVTADGLNVLEGSKVLLKTVEGSTVKCKNLLNLNDYIESPNDDTKAIGFDVMHLIVGKTYTFSTNAPFIKYFKIGTGWGSANSVITSQSTPFNTFTFTMARNSSTPTGNLYLFVGKTYKGMSSIEDFKPYFWQIEEGSTETEYQPYFTGLKNASFQGIKSTNADGTKENTLELPEAVECGLGTTIDFENKKIVNSGNTIVLTGEETWVAFNGYNIGDVYYSSMYWLSALPFSMTRRNGIATDGRVAQASGAHDEYGYGVWWVGVNNLALYIIGAERYFDFTQFANPNNPTAEERQTLKSEWIAFLKQRYADGNPVTIRYVSSTSTETPFANEQSAVGNEYTAHKDGSETVLGNSNQEFGAENTLTQDYILVTAVE